VHAGIHFIPRDDISGRRPIYAVSPIILLADCKRCEYWEAGEGPGPSHFPTHTIHLAQVLYAEPEKAAKNRLHTLQSIAAFDVRISKNNKKAAKKPVFNVWHSGCNVPAVKSSNA